MIRIFRRRRPDDATVTARLGDLVAAVPGVTGHTVSYNHQQYAAGALNGVVDVADSVAFEAVLRAVTAGLVAEVGKDTDRVTVYLSGRTPDGEPVVPGDLGFSQPPTGTELRRAYS